MLMSRVARSGYYLDGRSKSDIASELNISRFRVARLLEASRKTGLVRIVIEHEGSIDTDLSMLLQSTFDLAHAVDIHISADPRSFAGRLGEAAADLLQELVTADDVLGLAWGRSLSAIGTALTDFVPCPVVQLTGALSRPDATDVLELAQGGPGGWRASLCLLRPPRRRRRRDRTGLAPPAGCDARGRLAPGRYVSGGWYRRLG